MGYPQPSMSQPSPALSPRRGRRLLLVLAVVLLVVVGAPLAAWELWWPTNVDARALDDFGVPVPGATRVGPDYVSEGNTLCLDVCTRLTRSFVVPPSVTLGEVLTSAAAVARRAGYTRVFKPTCMVTNPATSQFMCAVPALGPGLSVNIGVFGVDPSVVTPTSIDGSGLPLLPDATPVSQIRVGVAKS